jgi:hypothetical protein
MFMYVDFSVQGPSDLAGTVGTETSRVDIIAFIMA